MACNLSLIVKCEGVFKVTGSHIYFKTGSTLKMVLDRDIVTTGYSQYRNCAKSSNCNDLGCTYFKVIC